MQRVDSDSGVALGAKATGQLASVHYLNEYGKWIQKSDYRNPQLSTLNSSPIDCSMAGNQLLSLPCCLYFLVIIIDTVTSTHIRKLGLVVGDVRGAEALLGIDRRKVDDRTLQGYRNRSVAIAIPYSDSLNPLET